MLQLHKALAALFAGCFCTMTFHQLPVLGSALLPRTRPIADAIHASLDGNTVPWAPPNPNMSETLQAEPEPKQVYSLPPELELEISEPMQTTAPPVATFLTTTTVTTATTAPETTVSIQTTTTETTAIPEVTILSEEDAPSEPEEEAAPLDDASLFEIQETWFKAYMDYRTITDTSSVQFSLQQSAWTDARGLRRAGDDYLVAMGTGWLTEGCGERFRITLESGTQFTVMVGDVKADCDTDATHRYRSCGGGANVLEFIVDTQSMSDEARNAGTVSVYPELEGNISEIAKIESESTAIN